MTAGSLGLLAFSAAIFAGLYAGNEVVTILSRAISALIVCLLLGAVIGWMAETVIAENLKAADQRENDLDRESEQAVTNPNPDQEPQIAQSEPNT